MSSEDKILSKAQEEEMSSALIAKLLAEEEGLGAIGHDDYYAEYSNELNAYAQQHHPLPSDDDDDGSYEDESEEDYAPKRSASGRGRGRPAKRGSRGANMNASGARKGRKRKTHSPDSAEKDASTSDKANAEEGEELAKATPTKKPRKPVQEGYNTGTYTEEEERRFLEGLELFGRNWSKIQAHIATRDANSIRSHAQKHFIKLFRDKIPLPAKVRESGEGYTLSGKPLDPNSAAARAYLSRRSASSGKDDIDSNQTNDADKDTSSSSPPPAAAAEAHGAANTEPDGPTSNGCEPVQALTKSQDATTAIDNNSTVDESANNSTKPASPPVSAKTTVRKKKLKSRSYSPEDRPRESAAYDENGRTDYSKSKLRRVRERTSVRYNQLGKDEDPLTLVKCEPFAGKFGSSVSDCQPFEMQVHSNVLLAMDFHAHLMTTEVIGFLAGSWDKANRRMCIKEAFPCRSLNTGQNDVNVEMDPTSAIETRQLIEEKNMMVVGWYHSHPMFMPDPSIVDIENQRNYQVLCREQLPDRPETIEPFVGAIIGPYDPRLPGSASVINWFYVSDGAIPKRLIYELYEDACLPTQDADRLLNLLHEYKDSPEKVEFASVWRQDNTETKLEKIIKSLATRMPWLQRRMKEMMNADAEGTKDGDAPDRQGTALSEEFLVRVQASLKGW